MTAPTGPLDIPRTAFTTDSTNGQHAATAGRQYGVRYGDGEIDGPRWDRDDAEESIANHRSLIREGLVDADDYEPMTLVSRLHIVQTTPWTEVS